MTTGNYDSCISAGLSTLPLPEQPLQGLIYLWAILVAAINGFPPMAYTSLKALVAAILPK
jgi:hypothetical protein